MGKPFELHHGERWYLVQCLARREAFAAHNLEAQGFRVFYPFFMKTVRHARKFRVVRQALFPGYLFVILDLDKDRWRSVNGTLGVSRLVMGQDYPQAVPRGVVEAIVENLDEAGALDMKRGLRPGAKARVVGGPFSDILGEIVALDDRGRARVLLEIMHGKMIVEIDQSKLQAYRP
jgi:transcription elongation factor/antiterminator RfaH